MTPVNDELALREALAEMTARQPAAPPDRYSAVRHRAARQRRRRLAGIAAAVAVLAAAAVTIPLGLHAIGPAPQAPQRHYHVSEQPPGPGAKRGLVATVRVDGVSYPLIVQRMPGLSGVLLSAGALGNVGVNNALTPASPTGDPVSFTTSLGGAPQADVGTVRSDVAYVTVTYGNGQVLTLHPVDVFGPRYAPFVVVAAPYPAAVVRLTAYSRTGELAYAIPFTASGSVQTMRWLRPGQPALPRGLTRRIGSGTIGSTTWDVKVAIGAWGTCVYGSAAGSYCWTSPDHALPRHTVVDSIGYSVQAGNVYVYPGQASSAVAYIKITTKDGKTTRVPVVAVGAQRYFAYADGPGNRVVRWAAYDASGRRLAAGTGALA